MNAKQIITYTAVFAAGALTVWGVSAFTAPSSTSAPAPQAAPVVAAETESPDPAPETLAEATPELSAPSAQAGVTAIGDLQRNMFVTVSGVVERVTDEDEFVIADSSGSVRVWTGNMFFTVEPGENVSVTGFVDDDMLIEIYAQEITRQDGTLVTIGSYSG